MLGSKLSATIAAFCKRATHDVRVGSFDDLDLPRSRRGGLRSEFRPLITGVGEDAFDEWKSPKNRAQQLSGAVAILNVGGQNAHAEQEAERVDEDVALAARDLLARVIALRVERRAPF